MPDELAYRLEVSLPAGWTAWSQNTGPEGPDGAAPGEGEPRRQSGSPGDRAGARRVFAWIGDPPARAPLAFATVDLVPRPVALRGSSPRDAALAVLRDLADHERWRPRDPALTVLRRGVRECALEGAAPVPAAGAPSSGSPDGDGAGTDRPRATADGSQDPAVLVDEWIAVGEGERRLVEHRVVVLRFPARPDARLAEAPYALRASAVTTQVLTDPPLVDAVRAIAAATRIEVGS